jgi:hypothetical protein
MLKSRLVRYAAMTVLAAVAANPALAQQDSWAGDGGVPAFYSWPAALPDKPGVMLRTEPAPADVSMPDAGSAERILYTSRDWHGPARTVTVSGIVFLPKGRPPRGGWPLIAWAHGTTGIADVCAPSLNARTARDQAYLGYWLAHGYAIVASDYQGLGTPGVHPYLQLRAEGMSVLDGVRAVLSHYSMLSPHKVITMGQSQGSEGAIAAAYLAPSYAPDLILLGTVATGIVAHTANVRDAKQVAASQIYPDPHNYANTAYEALWFLGAARSIDPQAIRPEDYLSAEGMTVVKEAQRSCMRGLVSSAEQRRIPIARFYQRSTDALEKRVDAATAFPDVRLRAPVFVGTGLDDRDAFPAKQYNFVSAMCAAGTVVELHYYRGADHSAAVPRSLADSPAFLDRLVKGRAVAGNCSSLTAPPAPGQQ